SALAPENRLHAYCAKRSLEAWRGELGPLGAPGGPGGGAGVPPPPLPPGRPGGGGGGLLFLRLLAGGRGVGGHGGGGWGPLRRGECPATMPVRVSAAPSAGGWEVSFQMAPGVSPSPPRQARV